MFHSIQFHNKYTWFLVIITTLMVLSNSIEFLYRPQSASNTPCPKNFANLFFSFCVGKIWTDFNKNWSACPGINTLENCVKLPTSPLICASTTLGNLKWQTELSTQYLQVHFNESLNSYIKTGSYCLENRQTCSKLHHLYIICSKCLSPVRTQA